MMWGQPLKLRVDLYSYNSLARPCGKGRQTGPKRNRPSVGGGVEDAKHDRTGAAEHGERRAGSKQIIDELGNHLVTSGYDSLQIVFGYCDDR